MAKNAKRTPSKTHFSTAQKPTNTAKPNGYETQSAKSTNYCEIEVVGEWFHDEVISTGFALLSRVLDCKKHKISLCDPWSANGLYTYYFQPHVHFQNHEIARKCRDKDFIVLPISDGYLEMRQKGEADAIIDVFREGVPSKPTSQKSSDNTKIERLPRRTLTRTGPSSSIAAIRFFGPDTSTRRKVKVTRQTNK
jgi:hypothetical protein